MAIGNMGPRRTPMNETATALPIKDGINHIVSSNLLDLKKKDSVHNWKKKGLKSTRLPEMRR